MLGVSVYWYNGQLFKGSTIELPISDLGLIYGATLFTTLRIYDQSLEHPLTNWQGHCDRLRHSLQALNWTLPNWERIRLGAESLLPSFPVLRITIFPDGREWITGRNLPENLNQRQQKGITGWVADSQEYSRPLPNHKTGNYLSAWLALQQAQQQGAQEAILINKEGHWLETSTGNLWGWYENQWWTPPLEAGILPGLARLQLQQWLQDLNPVQEVPWDESLVRNLEAIAYTNSVVEIIPFHTILTPHSSLSLNPQHPALPKLSQYFKNHYN